jgi:hypothetical protein
MNARIRYWSELQASEQKPEFVGISGGQVAEFAYIVLK